MYSSTKTPGLQHQGFIEPFFKINLFLFIRSMKNLIAELILISLLTAVVLLGIHEYSSSPSYTPVVERTEQVMGTYASITICDRNTTRANLALDAAFEEIKRIDTLMSLYNESSEVAALNRNGMNWTPLSSDTIYVLTKAGYYSRLSNGSFDITCNPLVQLWMVKVREEHRMPTPDEIKEASELVGYEHLIINEELSRARFDKEGMSITLGGIAKGYAVDRACEILLEAGIKHALVNIGGDMRAVGDKNGAPWEVALQNPRNKAEFILLLELENESVATSGDYERYFFLKDRIHHIINPKTGHSADECMSVTVITPRCIDADALATAVFVLGPEEGKALLDERGLKGLIIASDKRLIKSEAFR
ncbi:MAG: FAD:protein FMN transferase [Methanophagales archaeon ANME-1-THS]|nr:MAG: FAD:protein FMN transferase [Methanophagales archaeon ANME-1-THS]